MYEALWTDRAVGEFVRKQIGLAAKVFDAQIDLGDEQRALHGRLETGHEKSVVAAGIGKRHRAAGVATQAVRHEPFVTGGAVPVAADLAAECQICNLFITPRIFIAPTEM